MQIIATPLHGKAFLGKPTTVDPDWLAMQKNPFNDNAVFAEAYPFSGGAIVVDLNEVSIVGESTDQLLDELAPQINRTAMIAIRELHDAGYSNPAI